MSMFFPLLCFGIFYAGYVNGSSLKGTLTGFAMQPELRG